MSNTQDAIKFAYFMYNFRPTKVITKEQLGVFDKYYMEDETITLPMWYSKHLRYMKHGSIKEFDTFDKTFNQMIADQNLNRGSLIKLPRDFYFLAYDIIKSLKNGRYKERIEKLTEFKELRQKIILKSIDLGENNKIVDNMTFEEGLFYTGIIKSRKQLFSQVDSLKLEMEDEEE